LDREEKEFIRSVKDLKKMKRQESARKVFGLFGKAIPKGIRHPDSLVTNRHLYLPHRGRRRTILR